MPSHIKRVLKGHIDTIPPQGIVLEKLTIIQAHYPFINPREIIWGN